MIRDSSMSTEFLVLKRKGRRTRRKELGRQIKQGGTGSRRDMLKGNSAKHHHSVEHYEQLIYAIVVKNPHLP
jgi:hypothetical protein